MIGDQDRIKQRAEQLIKESLEGIEIRPRSMSEKLQRFWHGVLLALGALVTRRKVRW